MNCIIRGFKRSNFRTEEEMDAAGDGHVLVILDLRQDESLFEAGIAREIVNRVQKLRKKAGLEPTDLVEVYFYSLDEDNAISEKILKSQESYITGVLGSSLRPSTKIPLHVAVIAEENFDGISNLKFSITLVKPEPVVYF